MSFGLPQIGATPRTTVYVVTRGPMGAGVQAAAAAAVVRPVDATERGADFSVSAVPPAPPSTDAAQAREQLRQRIMAERGLDMRALYDLSSQDRIRVEATIMSEMALRTRQAQDRARAQVKGLGAFVDIRV